MLRHWQLRFLRLLLCLLFSVLLATGQDEDGPDDPEPEESDHGINQDTLTSDQMRLIHSKVDANADGMMSMAEILGFSKNVRLEITKKDVGTIADEMDTDRDGKLSLEELLKDIETWVDEGEAEMNGEALARKEVEIQKFKVADRNGDGVLDIEELPGVFYPETNDDVLDIAAAHTHKRKDRDGNGQLSPQEFWEGDGVDGQDQTMSKEEDADFAKLDVNSDGGLSVEELKMWEAGTFHTEDAMQKLFEIADENLDSHITADELARARERIAGIDAQYYLMEWAEHHEL